MSHPETTELRLKSTPTGGLDASHSPYYRRLLSAGYKGYMQGTIGGASLYGAIGLVIGGLLAVAAWPIVSTAALAIIPAAAGIGVVKGATTFGNIGSTAAINAESSDLLEQRRYLIDRYHDLPDGPEGDREAAEIRSELIRRQEINREAPPFFHWKTVLTCAVIGAALAYGFLALAPAGLLLDAGVFHLMNVGLESALAPALIPAFGAVAGALAGTVVGIDRYYVRKWFDVTENVVHTTAHDGLNAELQERSDLVTRLQSAAKQDAIVKANITQRSEPAASAQASAAPMIVTAPQLDTSDTTATAKPDTKISQATSMERLASLQHAMNVSL